MAALAQQADPQSVGITQVSEILYTPGVQLLGALPAPHGLATLYSAAVVRGRRSDAAERLRRCWARRLGRAVRQRGALAPATRLRGQRLP